LSKSFLPNRASPGFHQLEDNMIAAPQHCKNFLAAPQQKI
jgi:hypothetical protein